MKLSNGLGMGTLLIALSVGMTVHAENLQQQASAAMDQEANQVQESVSRVGSLTGTIDKINAEEQTISVDPGVLQLAQQVSVTGSTEIRDGERLLQLGQLQEGDSVTVQFKTQGEQKIGERIIINARAKKGEAGSQKGSRWY